jgi:hypothetical protein
MTIPTKHLPPMTAKLFKTLEVLTGFAESQRDDGVSHAPTEHIDDARAILRDTYATAFAMNPLNDGKPNPYQRKEIQ